MHHLPHHLTISEYAERKERSRKAVYSHIANGGIVPDEVGESKMQMIDWQKYGSYDIPTSGGNRTKKKA